MIKISKHTNMSEDELLYVFLVTQELPKDGPPHKIYDSFVCIASSKKEAESFRPTYICGGTTRDKFGHPEPDYAIKCADSEWTGLAEKSTITVYEIGRARSGMQPGVISSSYRFDY